MIALISSASSTDCAMNLNVKENSLNGTFWNIDLVLGLEPTLVKLLTAPWIPSPPSAEILVAATCAWSVFNPLLIASIVEPTNLLAPVTAAPRTSTPPRNSASAVAPMAPKSTFV